jgi:hypothetical protein
MFGAVKKIVRSPVKLLAVLGVAAVGTVLLGKYAVPSPAAQNNTTPPKAGA